MMASLLETNRPFLRRELAIQHVTKTLGPEYYEIVASQTWTFTPAYYSISFATPITGITSVRSFTEKQLSLEMDFYHRHSGQLLVHNERKLAFAAGSPPRSAFLPEASKVFLRSLRKAELASYNRINVPNPPLDAYKYNVTPVASDMDHYYHVNQASYLRYCTDAVFEAGRAGTLPSFPSHTDTAQAMLRQVSVAYKTESFPGDDLAVMVWESEPYNIHIVITKAPGNVKIFLASLLYYTSNSKL